MKRRIVGVLWLSSLLAGLPTAGLSREDEDSGQNPCRNWLAKTTATAEVLSGVILFHLDPVGPTEDRLAVLAFNSTTRQTKLTIAKCNNGETETVFTLEKPQSEGWNQLESFPSNGLVPGVVIWGGTEYSRSALIIVCYTGSYSYLPSGKRIEKKGAFKIVFQGEEAELVDLDLDGLPEIVAGRGKRTREIWTLLDGSYARVGAFPFARLRAADVLSALKAARERAKSRPWYNLF